MGSPILNVVSLSSGVSFNDLVAGGVDGGDSISRLPPATIFDATRGAAAAGAGATEGSGSEATFAALVSTVGSMANMHGPPTSSIGPAAIAFSTRLEAALTGRFVDVDKGSGFERVREGVCSCRACVR